MDKDILLSMEDVSVSFYTHRGIVKAVRNLDLKIASADAAYKDGILVVTMTIGGLMYEASVGGQKFKVNPY